jgi:hypothetical protein
MARSGFSHVYSAVSRTRLLEKVRSPRFAQAIVTCFQVNSFQRAINRGADYAKDHEENQQSEIQILF